MKVINRAFLLATIATPIDSAYSMRNACRHGVCTLQSSSCLPPEPSTVSLPTASRGSSLGVFTLVKKGLKSEPRKLKRVVGLGLPVGRRNLHVQYNIIPL
jgi:hypothetical protein